MMILKNKGLIIPALSLAALVVTGGAVFGYAVYDNYTFLADNNVQLSAELSNVRVARYTAVGDISAGDEIVYEGEGKNVELRQVYCSYPEELYILPSADTGTLYAQTDIPAGSPVLASQVAESEPLLTLEPERVVEEIPETYDIPYTITAVHMDRNGVELHENTQIQLSEGVGEQSLADFQETIDGYYLDSVRVNGRYVFSIGAVRMDDVDGRKMYYYYTESDGLERIELTGDLEIRFTYRQGELPEETASTGAFTGVPETAVPMSEVDPESPIVFENITGEEEEEFSIEAEETDTNP